jgi:hypothetical protein
MEMTYSSETLVWCYQTRRLHIAEGNNLYSHGHYDFKIKPHLQKAVPDLSLAPVLFQYKACSNEQYVLPLSCYGAAILHFRCKHQFLCSAARVHCLSWMIPRHTASWRGKLTRKSFVILVISGTQRDELHKCKTEKQVYLQCNALFLASAIFKQ